MKHIPKYNITIKCYSPAEISSELLNEMEKFLQSINPSLPKDHIKKNHLSRLNAMFYVVFEGKEICGLTSYSTSFIKHPMTGKKVFISVGGISYKNKNNPIKNLARIISVAHMKKYLGHFWFFKTILGVGKTVNPRLFVQFDSFFPILYPSTSKKDNSIWQHFLSEYLSLVENHPIVLNENLIDKQQFLGPEVDITDDFQTYYTSKNESVNNFFFENEIFIKREGRIYLTNKSLVLLGEYRLGAMLSKKMRLVLKKFRRS